MNTPAQSTPTQQGTPRRPRNPNWNTAAIHDIDGDGENAWILTYIDMLTLLLTLFVILLAYAGHNKEQYQQVTQAISEQVRTVTQTDTIEREVVKYETPPASNEKLNELAKQLQLDMEQSGNASDANISVEKGRVTLQLGEKILFESAEARLSGKGRTVLARVVPTLKKNSYDISIEGHTDDVPIADDIYPSNWELSASRATFVVREMLRLGIDKSRIRAVGYGDAKPIASNATAQGRATNRRVAIVIHTVAQ